MDDTSMTALAVTLTAIGGVATVLGYRRKGAAVGLKLLALTLLPMAALLTGTLRLAVGIVSDIGTWATRLVFSPVVWIGISMAGLAVVLYVLGSMLAGRQTERSAPPQTGGSEARGEVKAPRKRGAAKPADASSGGDDMDEIEAILRKHGI